MFEAVECYGWIVNNNIHGLEVVTEKKKGWKKSKLSLSTQTQPKIKGGNRDQRDG